MASKRPENQPTATLQLRLDQARIPWIFAALNNQPQISLYSGEIPDPFANLTYSAHLQREQLILTSGLTLREGFSLRNNDTVGSEQELDLLLKRYPQSRFSPDRSQLIASRDDQILGVIARVSPDTIVIQRGGQAGQLTLAEDRPVNSLATALDAFSTLTQRYIGSIWRASSETDQKQLSLVLDIPALPEGASETYFSTFEIVAPEFRGRPRPVDLDEQIGGYPLMKALVRSLILDATNPDASRRFGTQPFSNKLVLVTGREGTGKSLFPKALDVMLRSHFGDSFEHYRLPLQDMLLKYGTNTATIVETILGRIRANEKGRVPTLLHLDNLDALVPANQRNGWGGSVSPAEFYYSKQALDPILAALRTFGRELGGESHSVIVYGESRIPRSELPESVRQTFRRAFILEPDKQDLADILRAQVRQTRKFAEKTQRDPFATDVDSKLEQISTETVGATGRDIQQALLNIATKQKASLEEGIDPLPTTADDIISELNTMLLAQGGINRPPRPLGFPGTV